MKLAQNTINIQNIKNKQTHIGDYKSKKINKIEKIHILILIYYYNICKLMYKVNMQ